jgi:Tol biopolymer transport system component
MSRLVRPLALLPVLLLLGGCGSSSSRTPDLVFVSTRDGDYALFGAAADGSNEHRLSSEKGDPSTPSGLFFQVQPAWSPDARLIAFASRRDGRSHIYIMRPDGSGTRRITNSRMDDDHPSWSPDGRQIAFAREGALFVVAAGGGRARRLGHGLGNAADPAWSPNGKLLAYDYRRPGSSVREIWIAAADGSRPRPLTRLGAVSAMPAWSPNGRRIAFHSNVRAGHYEIYSIGFGDGLRRETRSSTDTFEAAWSPSGREIAFSRGGAIWAVDHARHARRITSAQNDSSPAWRPQTRSRSSRRG